MNPTAQQIDVRDFKGELLVVKSGAGTGKTSTLVEYALANPDLKMLFLAFNRAIRDDAADKFPSNVICKTTHSLAYSKFGYALKHKLQSNIRLTEIKNLCKCTWGEVHIIKQAFECFLSSKDVTIRERHFHTMLSTELISQLIKDVNLLWNNAKDFSNKFPCTHDVYLKLYHLSEPQLNFDTILFDECQDANDLQADLVLNQECNKVFVGDDHQQIYRWRYANNAMAKLIELGADVKYLTKSFRFGQHIADMANSILMYKHVNADVELMQLEGNGDAEDLDYVAKNGEKAILHRTVYGTIETAIKTHEKVFWIGGISSYNIDDLLDVYFLQTDQKFRIRNKMKMKDYDTYSDYIEIAEASKDVEMKRAIRILDENTDIEELIGNLNYKTATNPKDAGIVITTSHRAKGLEFPVVQIADDFSEIPTEIPTDELGVPQMSLEEFNAMISDELNLMYVAVTRAKKKAILSQSIKNVIIAANNLNCC